MKELLEKLRACYTAREWAIGKSWQEVYRTCHRGDWLLWLHFRTNPKDMKIRTLVKGHCANTVRHLMQDDRSRKAVDAAISFGEGKITKKELDAAAADAYAAYIGVPAAAAAGAAADADADAVTADTAARAAARAAAADAAAAAADAARTKNQRETADIVRKYIPIEKWNIDNNSNN
jgi:hypothetical protein